MKKLAFIAAVVVMFALMSGVAFAETPHGPFDDNTALCAACHRTHTAQDDYLLGQQNVTNVCIDCHNLGTGADTDVVNGIYISNGTQSGEPDKAPDHEDWGTVGRVLMGGGFMNVQGVGSTATSSKHFSTTNRDLTYDVTFGTGTAPGGTIAGQTEGVMDCVDCHLPHRSTNYRMLRQKPNGTSTALIVQSNVILADSHKYTDDVGQFNVKIPAGTTNDGISKWCGVCHNYYYNNSKATDNNDDAREAPFSATYYDIGGTTAADLTYMHAVDADLMYTARNGGNNGDNLSAHLSTSSNANVLPVASGNGIYDENDMITCLTCHRAHGSEVSSGSPSRVLSGKTIPAGDSNLLRLQKLGVCETCHDMPQGYTP